MDDILAKKNRHLFLEEKDNQNNSFIGNINDVANRKEELDIVATHITNVDTVVNHIDNVDTIANNISDINDAVDNIATVKTFNDNVNNGTIQYYLEAFTTSLNNQGNAWEVRLTQLGESILATTSAFNYSTVVTVSSDISANGTLILPNSMKYKVGTHMLMVSWNGTVCYAGEQYDEVGAYGVWATSIVLKQPAKAGDKIQLRVVALAEQSYYVDITEAAINASQFIANGSDTERYLPEFLGDVVNVKNFGAIGDGVNDDTAAFQSAIASGKAVFVPEGTYKLNTNLNGVFCGVGNSIFTGSTVNGSTILRGIAQRNSDVINVKDYGAKGNGVTDDTSAFEIAASSGKHIFIPDGTYKLHSNVNGQFFSFEDISFIGGLVNDSNFLANILNSKYKGKRLSILGDSISTFEGYIPEGNATYYPNVSAGVLSVNETWWYKLYTALGMILDTNNSWSGSRVTIATDASSTYIASSGITRCTSLGNPDVIIVYLGINDFANNISLGDYDGSDTLPDDSVAANKASFREGYSIMLSKLLATYPTAEIWCATLPQANRGSSDVFPTNNDIGGLELYNKAIRELANAFGIKILDLANCGLTFWNREHFGSFHPNPFGHSLMANYAISILDNSVKKQYKIQ